MSKDAWADPQLPQWLVFATLQLNNNNQGDDNKWQFGSQRHSELKLIAKENEHRTPQLIFRRGLISSHHKQKLMMLLTTRGRWAAHIHWGMQWALLFRLLSTNEEQERRWLRNFLWSDTVTQADAPLTAAVASLSWSSLPISSSQSRAGVARAQADATDVSIAAAAPLHSLCDRVAHESESLQYACELMLFFLVTQSHDLKLSSALRPVRSHRAPFLMVKEECVLTLHHFFVCPPEIYVSPHWTTHINSHFSQSRKTLSLVLWMLGGWLVVRTNL